MRLLALDLSTHVGWAFYSDRASPPAFGTWHAPRFSDRDNLGGIFDAFEKWLDVMLGPADVVAFEAPILPHRKTFQKARAIRISYGLAEIVERTCYRRKLRCVECYPSSVKKRLAGFGNARKHHMVAAATKLGFDVGTDHEADAIGVALVAFDHFDPTHPELLRYLDEVAK